MRRARSFSSATVRSALLGAVAVFGGVSAARGQLIPATESGPAIVTLQQVSKNWEMRDAQSGKLLMQQRNCVPLSISIDPQVQRVVEMHPQPSGYDMVVTFKNPTDQARAGGRFFAGMFTLGPNVTYYDFRYNSNPVDAAFSTYVGQAFNYPDSSYSPVWVMKNAEYAVGVSVLYPILEYGHDCRVGMMNPSGSNSGEGGPGWGIECRTANYGNEDGWSTIPHPAVIPPKSERTYVLSVRVTKNPDEWVRTLTPYRDFFRARYGGVTYKRDTRPVKPEIVAESSYLAPDNQLGFAWIASRRPDKFGWQPWVSALKGESAYTSLMLWAPSGLYYNNRANNFPFQMTSHWLTNNNMAEALDPVKGLKSVADSGKIVGLWWGRSVQYASEWDPAAMEPFDPDNPAHRAAALHEMDLATEAGVTLVGLDTFNPGYVSISKLYPWLRDLRRTYPKVRFVVEPNACDLLHTLAASYIAGWTDDTPPTKYEDLYRIKNPHYLADFLLPGHETWAGFRYNGHKKYFGMTVDQALLEKDSQHFAEMGYVPAIFEGLNNPPGSVAASWATTVPADLRLSANPYPLGWVTDAGRQYALAAAFKPDSSDGGSTNSAMAPGAGGGGAGGGGSSSGGPGGSGASRTVIVASGTTPGGDGSSAPGATTAVAGWVPTTVGATGSNTFTSSGAPTPSSPAGGRTAVAGVPAPRNLLSAAPRVISTGDRVQVSDAIAKIRGGNPKLIRVATGVPVESAATARIDTAAPKAASARARPANK